MGEPILDCKSCTIRHKAICNVLNEAELGRLGQIARKKTYGPGDIIQVEGEPVLTFANVSQGVIKLTKIMQDGRQQIVGLLFPPDFLGRVFGQNNPYYAEAATEVELCYFPRAPFERLLADVPSLEHRLFEVTLNELDACRDWTLLLGRKTAEQRVAHFLSIVAKRAPNLGCHHSPEMSFVRFDLPLSRGDIADYLGLTLETVSRQMSRLKAAGTISVENFRTITVPDMEKLTLVASLD